MKANLRTALAVGCVALAVGVAFAQTGGKNRPRQLFDEGNFREALDASKEALARADASSAVRVDAFDVAMQSTARLDEWSEADAFREQLVDAKPQDWRLLASVAQSWINQPHHGYEIAGKFHRGNHRGGGKMVNAAERDRVRALQLYAQAWQAVETDAEIRASSEGTDLYARYAGALMFNRGGAEAWRLQSLTPIDELPDYEENWYGWRPGTGAPVDAEGNPVLFKLPASWEAAASDGERWRWLVERPVAWNPARRLQADRTYANFLHSLFGVQTLAEYRWWFGRQAEAKPSDTGTFALHTLGEDETIARLATGIKRFALPDEHNPIKLNQSILADGDSNLQSTAASWLAGVFENRRQYNRAADHWREFERLSPGKGGRDRIAQIEGNWGRFEPVMSQPAGQGATVDFRFRNGKRVEFVARRIDVPQLLADLKSYLKSEPKELNWNRMQLENLGYRLVTEGREKYLGAEAARWSLDLEPLADHFDRRITVATPLQKAGAYLLTARMADGNTSHIVMWLQDTAIVQKPLEGRALYYVSDAVSGKPIADCNVEFFGYWQEHTDGNRYLLHTKNFAEKTSAEGLTFLASNEDQRRYQWIATATTPGGRLAYLGFTGIWTGEYYNQEYKQVKVFSITDRPVYRPAQTMEFKFWVRHAQYDLKNESTYAGQAFQIEIRDPKNEKVYGTQLTAGAYGGLAGKWDIPAGAMLGQYQVNVVNHGGGSFRVEEYKKPEFEVTVEAPTEPVKLGEKFTATIIANYYFGSPVVEATVRYKVLRTPYQQAWYPPMPWDWLYGPGYWWFAPDYPWYPGWARWGCFGPTPWWFWQAPVQPEVIAERELPIGPDGKISVEIDTATALEFHPDQDHSYQIQAEVVDRSRRTIVGNGQVLVAREPAKVFVWTDRGYYRVGDTVGVGATARSLDGKPVLGSGTLRLLEIRYENAQPVETEVGSWKLDTSAEGMAELQIKASTAGRYRLSFEVTDAAGRTFTGGHIFTVMGGGVDGSEFRFNDLEVIPDRREYQPGEKVALQINSNRAGVGVLLFVRPSNGVYLPPQYVALLGKTKIVELDVTQADMPNFFVEAVAVHGGKAHTVTRELFVPPAERVLNLEVLPSAEAYLPGQAAQVLLKLTDENGKPFVGSLAVTIYDKALEYISSGSNVAGIREFFWKWRRQHRPQGQDNLTHLDQPLSKPNEPTMQNLGIFGETVVDEISTMNRFDDRVYFGIGGGGEGLSLRSRSMDSDFSSVSGIAVPMMAEAPPGEMAAERMLEKDAAAAPPAEVQPTVRQAFADTAKWVAQLETNAEGIAELSLDMPENLSTWKVRAWGMGHGTRVGEGSAEVVTRKNLIVRLQAPRFFIERDEVVLSANVHNYLTMAKQVRVVLELDDDALQPLESLEHTVEVDAGGEARVDWRVRAVKEGIATIRANALTNEESDAMQIELPVHVHGMLKTDSYTGVLRPTDESGQFEFTVPAERRAEQTRLEVRYTPTLAGAMIDALPYLIDYPYGCTEQTLNRFLPAVLTRQTLSKMGVDLAAIREKRTNLNAQEIGDDRERAARWQRGDTEPVFDETQLDRIVKAGVNRLTEMQLGDGGWGWFSGWGEHSYPHTTATVVHGLQLAEHNGVAIVPDSLQRGIAWLENYQAEQVLRIQNWERVDDNGKRAEPNKPWADNTDALVYMVLAEAGREDAAMREFLYRDRTKLAVYCLANFGLGLHHLGHDEQLAMVMRNLGQYVREDDENQTAWLELPGGGWWYWYDSEYEAQAYYLKLLAAVEPQSEVAPRMVKYLLNNRRHATYWNSTRDTALVVEAFADYLTATGEASPEVTVELWIDGQQRKRVAISSENLFSFDNKLVLTGTELEPGRHTVEIHKVGNAPIYYNGYLTNFTLEDDIAAAGLELKVERAFYKLTPVEAEQDVAGGRGQVVNEQVEKFERTPLVNFAELTSGDLIEVELVVESKNDYEYIQLEDMKAAGFEPVEVRSGYNGNELGAYVEYRDDRVGLFVARLARGRHSVSYRLRAEVPGRFSALPARAAAMYAPELRANSGESKLTIHD